MEQLATNNQIKSLTDTKPIKSHV